MEPVTSNQGLNEADAAGPILPQGHWAEYRPANILFRGPLAAAGLKSLPFHAG